MRIYLAGKIDKNDWRHTLMPLRGAWDSYSGPSFTAPPWPEIKFIDLPATYVGPYFAGCDHGCTHGASGHAASAAGCYEDLPPRSTVPARCYKAIDRCDLFFAWLDDLTAFGTLVEIGYAKAKGKKVVIASPRKITGPECTCGHHERPWDCSEGYLNDLWFAAASGTLRVVHDTPQEALRHAVGYYTPAPDPGDKCESPAERNFWAAVEMFRAAHGDAYLPGLVPQVAVGRYRLDFAIPAARFAVEIDGHNYHSTPAQKASDTVRQRELEMLGWRVIRFTGREVFGDRALDAVATASKFYESLGKA